MYKKKIKSNYIVERNENRLKFLDGRLNKRTFVDFSIQIYNAVQNRGYREIILDFSSIEKAYPNGVVPMICLIEKYKQSHQIMFRIIEPKHSDAKSLFERNLWFYFIDKNYNNSQEHNNFSNLPLQRFNNDEELNNIINETIKICLKQLVFGKGVIDAFEWALNEIAGNILVHSKSQSGWLQLTTYTENHKLALIVCDSGIGIPTSMKSAYETIKTDQDALEMAIRKGVTSNPKYGQGNGLAGCLSIAQGSQGSFDIISGRGHIELIDGNLSNKSYFPPFEGTCVEMQFSTQNHIDLPKALWGHKPVNYIENTFEDEAGNLLFDLREYASSFGNRITGEKLRNLLMNLIKQNQGSTIQINMNDIGIISSSFADELFGKLVVELGVIDFGRLIKFQSINPTCKSLIDVAIAQRLAQNIGYVTPVNQDN